jgi:cell cycle sensor histidine kinase DivJ
MRARRHARGGAPAQVMSLLRNVTASKQAMNDIEAARQSAEAASRSRDHFLANMSHELRTPLNAIIGFSEILGNRELRPADEAKQTEYARIIHQSGQHLLAVVNSILDMAKLQSGTFSIIPETFDIGPLIESCCEIVTLKAHEGRIEILRADTRGIEPVVGDRRACKQILINLLSNAIKFTPENGRVTIAARPDGNSLVISVTDTGIGIGAADLARLGDPFFQVKSALDRPYEGTGLGLSVVRGLVGLHGGSIMIASEPGHGTAVTIRLPLDCRFAGQADPSSAKIETIARHRSSDRLPQTSPFAAASQLASLPPDTMVKKSA